MDYPFFFLSVLSAYSVVKVWRGNGPSAGRRQQQRECL